MARGSSEAHAAAPLWETIAMPATPEDVRRQLERVLSSPVFTSSGRLSRFLEFIVERTLAGDGERLKEYVIGIEVFDRDSTYDPRLDSIVRVEAARLRTKLTEYYAGDGRTDPIVLTLPKGGYAPVVNVVEPAPTAAAQAATTDAPSTATEVAPQRRSRRVWSLAAVAAVVVVAIAIGVRAPWTAENVPRLRVAVTPFDTYSTDPAEQMLATRLTEGVTAELVRLDTFEVVASSTARAIATGNDRVRDLAAALEADVLIQARVVTEGDGLRVEARAVSGTLEHKFWVQSFHGHAADLDSLEREIAAAVAEVRYDPPQ
jgi:adenylate cyclase